LIDTNLAACSENLDVDEKTSRLKVVATETVCRNKKTKEKKERRNKRKKVRRRMKHKALNIIKLDRKLIKLEKVTKGQRNKKGHHCQRQGNPGDIRGGRNRER